MFRRALLAAILLALGVGACSGAEPDPTDTPSAPSTTTEPGTATGTGSPPATTPVVPSVSVGPGEVAFHYNQGLGLTATLTLGGAEGQLTLENATGGALGTPGVYVLDRFTGERADATVSGPPSIEDGSSASYEVSFGGGFDAAESAGLVALTIGGDDVGAFVPL